MCQGQAMIDQPRRKHGNDCNMLRNPRSTNLNLSLIALGAALGLCLQQILWSATHLASNGPHCADCLMEAPSTQEMRSTDDNDSRRTKFSQLKTPPSEIYVLGERNSGTKYAASVLREAFHPPNKVASAAQVHEYFATDIPVLKHKHMFRHTLLDEAELSEVSNRSDILWILAVRSPCEWAEAMYRLPYHMCPPNDISSECPGNKFIGFEYGEDLRNYSLSEFFEMEWGDWPESTNFRNLSFVGKDFVYENLFHLRRHKLLLMRQIIDTVPRNVKIVRLHELERSPATFIKNLVQEFKLKVKQDYKPRQRSHKIHTEMCLAQEEWDVAQRQIDWAVENSFGYTFLDCHLCYD